jgi:hypothetical protein
VSKYELFDHLSQNLSIFVQDVGRPASCGGEVDGETRVRVGLVLTHPVTGKPVVISEEETSLD